MAVLVAAMTMSDLAGPAEAFALRSRSFEPGGPIPAAFAMKAIPGGQNRSIELHWTAPPKGTRSLALSVIDLNPVAHGWVHWLVVDLAPAIRDLPAGASGHLPGGATELRNSFGSVGYGGPQPPAGTGVHRYEATVWALSVDRLPVDEQATWKDVRAAMDAHVLGHAAVSGIFER